MLYDLSNEDDRARCTEYVERLKTKGARVEIVARSSRTIKQNNYLHLILSFFGAKFGYTLDDVKEYIFKRKVNPDLFLKTITTPDGEELQATRSTTELTSAELTTAVDRFRNWSVTKAGLYLPNPDEREDNAYKFFCLKVVKNNNEFL